MLKITDENYAYYKRVFEALWEFKAHLIGVDSNVSYSPIKVLDSWEKKNKSIAKKGLKAGLNDILTMIMMEITDEVKKDLNEQLINGRLPSLNNLVGTIKDVPQKVFKRGKIKNLQEYYIIKEYLANQTPDISKKNEQQLERIFSDFESCCTKKG